MAENKGFMPTNKQLTRQLETKKKSNRIKTPDGSHFFLNQDLLECVGADHAAGFLLDNKSLFRKS
jgi:surfactin synthase thioesterase subunit